MSLDKALPGLSGLVLWLIPAEPHASFYRKVIRRLSIRYKTNRFAPHLTLGRLADDNVKLQKLRLPDKLLSPNSWHFSSAHSYAECRPSPYQNLVHVLNPNHDLDQLQIEFKSQVPDYQPKEEYHISLMYGDIPCSTLDQEIADLSGKFPKRVTFSKICVIELNGQPVSWRTIWELEF